MPLVVVVSAMGDTTDDLIALAGQVTKLPDARELDLLMATGELVSAALLVMALHDRGVDAISLSGRRPASCTDGSFGRARITGVEPARVRQELDNGRVVVVAGFQGSTGSEVATLGRGGIGHECRGPRDHARRQALRHLHRRRRRLHGRPTLVPDARRLAERRLRGDARACAPGRQGASD